MVPHRLVRRNYDGKLPVSMIYQNLHSFKEEMIHLCQSILETRRISYLHGSAPFTISLEHGEYLKRFSLKNVKNQRSTRGVLKVTLQLY